MNENKKIKYRVNELDLLSMIFTPIGIMSFVIGVLILSAQKTVGSIFTLMGILFFAAGIALFYYSKRKRDEKSRVFSEGMKLEAKIHRISYNSSVTINGKSPHIIECSYRDPRNNFLHVFKSENVFKDITLLKEGDPIFVYVNPVDYNQYYVDIDSAFEIAGIIHH